MSDYPSYTLVLADLLAEREALRNLERQVAKELQQREDEEDTKRRERLDEFRMTDDVRKLLAAKLKHAISCGETELMLLSFASEFCSDGGRAVASASPSNPGHGAQHLNGEPSWLATLPKGMYSLYCFWRDCLEQGGFGFEARIVCYPEGRTGDVGLFVTWPPSASRHVN